MLLVFLGLLQSNQLDFSLLKSYKQNMNNLIIHYTRGSEWKFKEVQWAKFSSNQSPKYIPDRTDAQSMYVLWSDI